MKLPNLSKKQWISIFILLLFIITNPSIKDFKEHLGHTTYRDLNKSANLFVCTVYSYDSNKYIGVLGNFIQVVYYIRSASTHDNPSNDPFKEFGGNVIDSSAVDTASLMLPPLPKGFTRIKENDSSTVLDSMKDKKYWDRYEVKPNMRGNQSQ
ncbi:hypothetical protein SNE25_18305 [Mucilaginibacter sabulilitoris]|uniref:Uncharacterized protein n=1 Tax=Mucilaginibacter sabulilitoris TaxID=1173583 RepID=A0ABZ0TE74_9SPHI|nr:hypothetical protein [Mucilaginibacter sabulilitoris]WPU91272.1 hypothetical protein SNE25_18305 [Mucilaginibacter sabulilitoris]